MQCKKCASTNSVKHGRTPAGQQPYHCRDCGVYMVTDERAQERQARMNLGEKLHRERVSQRGIARATGVSRSTSMRWLRKKSPGLQRGNDSADPDPSRDRERCAMVVCREQR